MDVAEHTTDVVRCAELSSIAIIGIIFGTAFSIVFGLMKLFPNPQPLTLADAQAAELRWQQNPSTAGAYELYEIYADAGYPLIADRFLEYYASRTKKPMRDERAALYRELVEAYFERKQWDRVIAANEKAWSIDSIRHDSWPLSHDVQRSNALARCALEKLERIHDRGYRAHGMHHARLSAETESIMARQ